MWRSLLVATILFSTTGEAKGAPDSWLTAEQEASLHGWRIQIENQAGQPILETVSPVERSAITWTDEIPRLAEPFQSEIREQVLSYAKIWGGARFSKLRIRLTPMTKKPYKSLMSDTMVDRWLSLGVAPRALTPDQAREFLGPDLSFCQRFLLSWSTFF